ncbi:hypothetical protein C7999DRAFT_35201 [Corynascus novoguineensis]|uniref:Uncharacterized protein n=1 Tax=Corynascus novoguineensis TaxID=1126955 RepID=A0AAN7HGF1_9PEZI|nr:hypothetical protein C7999DRAFT_35201 [Corynascus novoguineensis]
MAYYKPNGYMQYETIRDCYEQLNTDSLENLVGNMWNNILREYFFNREGFQLEVQPRSAPGKTKNSNDVTICYIKNGTQKHLVLIEHERVTLKGSDTIWKDAFEQVTEYMLLTHSKSTEMVEDMFGIVSVGRYSRFYILKSDQITLIDHPVTGGALLEFKKDEMEVVDLLLSIKVQALRTSPAAPQGPAQARPGSRDGTTASHPGSREASH